MELTRSRSRVVRFPEKIMVAENFPGKVENFAKKMENLKFIILKFLKIVKI